MPAIYCHNVNVTDDHIDIQGHANNLVYLRWMQDAAVAHSAAQGWDGQRYQELSAGWVVRSHFIEYQSPAFAGDAVTVRTWVSDFRKVTSVRNYRIVRGAETLAVAETNWAFIDLERRVPKRVPAELIKDFEIVLSDGEIAP
jgi:acyl-CoA thioester hydrolase